MASSDFVNWGTAKRVAYFWKDGAVQQDEAHDPAKGFRLYLQQREAGWMPQDGEHINVSVTDLLYGSGSGAVDTRGLGPGLACYTPEALDRCAVLIFEPKDGGHVLTGAYGVIEQPAATSAEAPSPHSSAMPQPPSTASPPSPITTAKTSARPAKPRSPAVAASRPSPQAQASP
jgi:hypothetical protein